MRTDLIKPEKPTTIVPEAGSKIPNEPMTLEQLIKLMGINDVMILPEYVEYQRSSFDCQSMQVQVKSINNLPLITIEFNFEGM